MKVVNELIIYGAGGLGRGIAELIEVINRWKTIGFVDDFSKEKSINSIPNLGNLNYLKNINKPVNVVIALGDPNIKYEIYQKLKGNENVFFPNIIHPSVEFSSTNKIGMGNVISKGVSISTNIEMGNFNLIHYNCSIGHDVKMDNFNSIFPLSSVSGYVHIGSNVEIGTTAAIIPDIYINDHAILGAGTVVTKNINQGQTIVGVPGESIKTLG